jgi:hypothetical protein
MLTILNDFSSYIFSALFLLPLPLAAQKALIRWKVSYTGACTDKPVRSILIAILK